MSVNFPIFWSDGERSGLFVFASIYSGGCFFINVNTYKHSYSNLSSFVKRKTKFLKFFGHLYTSKVVATKNVHLRLYNVVCAGMYLLCRLLAEHILHRRHCLYSIFERVGSRHPPLHFFPHQPSDEGFPASGQRPAAAPFSRPGEPSKRRWPRHAGKLQGMERCFAGQVGSIGGDGNLVSLTE